MQRQRVRLVVWRGCLFGRGESARLRQGLIALVLLALASGCGINKARLATEQLVISDAVDRAVASIDFSPLSGREVYFDSQYIEKIKVIPNANVEYVISSLRQQMAAYDCRLQEKPEDAEFIVEARLGVLGNDGHEVTYGMPGGTATGTAAAFMPTPLPLPALPELSLGRRNHQQGTAKIGVFAYDRLTREPVWQAGVAKGSSRARDLWVFGLGPFEHRATAASRSRRGEKGSGVGISNHLDDPLSAYEGSVVFRRAIEKRKTPTEETSKTVTASHEQPVPVRLESAPATSIPAPNDAAQPE